MLFRADEMLTERHIFCLKNFFKNFFIFLQPFEWLKGIYIERANEKAWYK